MPSKGQINTYYFGRYRKPNKYRNVKITADGMTFDSQKEYERYCVLKLMQKSGRISGLQRQVKYLLIPSQKGEIRNEKPCNYKADFVYVMDGKTVVEDVKSEATRKNKDYVIKRKLMKYVHNIEVQEV